MLNMCHKPLFSIYDRVSKSEIHFLVESRSYKLEVIKTNVTSEQETNASRNR